MWLLNGLHIPLNLEYVSLMQSAKLNIHIDIKANLHRKGSRCGASKYQNSIF